jgi:hypothetical protein
LLEDIAYCRALDPRWVEEQLINGQSDEVIALARVQVVARELAEKFVPIWLQAEVVTGGSIS